MTRRFQAKIFVGYATEEIPVEQKDNLVPRLVF